MALRGRGSYNIGVKLEGNWFKFNEIVSSTDVLLVMAAREGQRKFAEEFRDRVKANILTGGKRFGYTQHSPRYLIWKLKRGGPSSLLVWSRSFYASVEIRENKTGSRFMVGIPKGEKRPPYTNYDKNKLTIAEYANVLEHGTKNMPARPVFSDTFRKELGGTKALKKFVNLAIIKKFGLKGAIITKI